MTAPLLAGLGHLAAGIALLWLALPLERLIEPRTRRAERPPAATLLHWGLLGLGFGLSLALLQRPLFAAGGVLAFWLLVILVNNAKYRALAEPFVFSDFELFSQVFRFPRLYLPFLGWRGTLALPAAVGLVLYAGLALEPSLTGRVGVAVFLLLAGLLVAGSLLCLRRGSRAGLAPTFNPLADLARFGLPASLWLYGCAERRQPEPGAERNPFARAGRPAPAERPHLIVVQSESFFDARRLPLPIRPEILRQFDRARQAALVAGTLTVPAYGANTMRSEFAFLSGIPGEALGVHQFNPYRRFARQSRPSLPRHLRALGYRTVCVHPHDRRFFGRDRVFPVLGIDEFIDAAAFAGAPRAGPYVADAAVTGKLLELLAGAEQPLFLFAITMENHGPLHLERARSEDVAALYREPPPAGCEDLTVYLRHLANADRMIGELLDALETSARDVALVFFGDHVPSMPAVYRQTGYSDGRTDFFIWRKGGTRRLQTDLDVAELGPMLLESLALMRLSGSALTPEDRAIA